MGSWLGPRNCREDTRANTLLKISTYWCPLVIGSLASSGVFPFHKPSKANDLAPFESPLTHRRIRSCEAHRRLGPWVDTYVRRAGTRCHIRVPAYLSIFE